MLLRAAVIYVLAVCILLLGGAVAVQRIQIATVKGERVAAENLSNEMRQQIDRLRSEKSDLERLIRLARVAAECRHHRGDPGQQKRLIVRRPRAAAAALVFDRHLDPGAQALKFQDDLF